MQKLQKHRLILLLGILVALLFFYLGVNTWMETQQRRTAPPPVVRAKPPVQTKPEAKQVKPQTPKTPQTQRQQPQKPPVKKAEQPKKQKEVRVAEKKTPKPTRAQTVQKTPTAKQPPTKKPLQARAGKKTPLKEFVAQIGAFKVKSNAERNLRVAKQKGFTAFIVEEDGLYKVRVRFKAQDLRTALRKVRKTFEGAFIVR